MSAAPKLLEPIHDAACFASRTGATPDQLADLRAFQALLADWNGRINLVSEASLEHFWARHALDSAQLAPIEPRARIWVDIGAGAGFPGVVLAILMKGKAGSKVHLVESQAKRCRFLEAAVTALGLPAEVHCARAERLSIAADVVTARAVAPLTRLLELAQPYLVRGAVGLFLKGQGAEAQIIDAQQAWRFDLERIVSLSDPAGRILKIGRLARAR
jgi:16S rRNA (guanine527-N7)-methyltransferase